MTDQTPATSAELNQDAQQRMKRWVVSPSLEKYLKSGDSPALRAERFGPYICLSREPGSGGAELARLLGERLGWDVLDRELLDFMAEQYRVPRDVLEFVDETKANWIHNTLGSWFNTNVVTHEKFISQLKRILLLAGMHGRVVIVGRGAHCILPRRPGLAVRVIAPLERRILAMAERNGISEREAKKLIHDIETGRRDFGRRYFQNDIHDPHSFDLVLNFDLITIPVAADLIVDLFTKRHAE